MVRLLPGMVWAGALMVLASCTTTAEIEPVALDKGRPNVLEVYQSPELTAYGISAQTTGDPEWSGGTIASDSFGYFKALIAKPLFRPFSSLKRLFFLTTNTAIDLVKPVSLLWEADGPVPLVSQRPGMDLRLWEQQLDVLTGTQESRGSIRLLIDGDQFFPRFVDAVMAAQSSIHLRSYIFDTDDYATAIADLLKQRSEQIEVKVLLDGLGTLWPLALHRFPCPELLIHLGPWNSTWSETPTSASGCSPIRGSLAIIPRPSSSTVKLPLSAE